MVKAELQDVSGIRRVAVDVKSQTASAVFDPAQTDLGALREAVGQAGYTAKSETVIDG